jgi:hypothetical protein
MRRTTLVYWHRRSFLRYSTFVDWLSTPIPFSSLLHDLTRSVVVALLHYTPVLKDDDLLYHCMYTLLFAGILNGNDRLLVGLDVVRTAQQW